MDIETIFERLKAHPNIKTKSKVAEICGISPPALNYWKQVPSRHCIDLEAASEGTITRYEMRPDVFGPEPTTDIPESGRKRSVA